MKLSSLSVFLCAVALTLSGCMSYEQIKPDGTRTVVRQVGVPRAVYVSPDPDYGWDNRYYRGGDTRGIACTGPFGTTINGTCFNTREQCRAVYGRKICG